MEIGDSLWWFLTVATGVVIFLVRRHKKKAFKYKLLDRVFVSYTEADKMIRETADMAEEKRWVLDTEREDYNIAPNRVHLCRKRKVR